MTDGPAAATCPTCARPGRIVDEITLKAFLRPTALERRSAPRHRFCATAACPVVYFGDEEVFLREDVIVPVFQKEPDGDRTVCYCFALREGAIQREVRASRRSASTDRIRELVQAGRCACEVRNPQGTCCLGNVTAVARAALAELTSEPTMG